MPSLQVSSDPATLTHRQCVALLRLIYPAGPGFDYKRKSLAELQAFLAAVRGTYPQAYDAAVQAFLTAHAVPAAPVAPPAPPAPYVAPIMAPPAAVAQPIAPTAPPSTPAVVVQPAPAPEPAPAAPAPVAAPPVECPPVVQVSPAPAPVAAPTTTPIGANVTLRPASALFPGVAWPDGFAADQCMLRCYASPDAPAADPLYVFNPHALMLACIALSAPVPLPIWCYGDKGTGKSEFAPNVAAALGRPFVRIQCDRNLERAEFVGTEALDAGTSVWKDGALLAACRVPGSLILLDEPSYLSQGNVSVLNGLLEVRAKRQYRTTAGELVTFAPDVAFFGADNTNGAGDESGQFVGTHALNTATCERFLYFIRFDYLPPKAEAKLLHKKTGAPDALCMGIAGVLHACRQKANAGHIPAAPSMRGAVAFLLAVQAGVRPADAFECSVTGRAAPEAQEEFRALFAAHWPADVTGAKGAPPAPDATLAPGAGFDVPAPGNLGRTF